MQQVTRSGILVVGANVSPVRKGGYSGASRVTRMVVRVPTPGGLGRGHCVTRMHKLATSPQEAEGTLRIPSDSAVCTYHTQVGLDTPLPPAHTTLHVTRCFITGYCPYACADSCSVRGLPVTERNPEFAGWQRAGPPRGTIRSMKRGRAESAGRQEVGVPSDSGSGQHEGEQE